MQLNVDIRDSRCLELPELKYHWQHQSRANSVSTYIRASCKMFTYVNTYKDDNNVCNKEAWEPDRTSSHSISMNNGGQ